MTELALFFSSFVLVFLLGFQSRNVNSGEYMWAFFTSAGIGLMQIVMYKLAPTATTPELAAFLLGGPAGIVCAMWSHKKLKERHVARPYSIETPKVQG